MEKEATLFPIRKTWWYIPRPHLSFYAGKGSQGAGHFVAPNPPFGAVFTYYLKEDLKTLKDIRKEKERELNEKKKDMPFPGWDAIEAERRQETPKIWISVEDGHGNVVRRVPGPAKKGFHRVAWDLRYPAADAIDLDSANDEPGSGFLAPPGTYSATLYKQVDGQVSQLAESQQFEVVHLREGALPGSPPDVTAAFWRDYENATRTASALRLTLRNALTKVEAMKLALATSTAEAGVLDERLHDLRTELLDLDERLSGNRSKQQPGEKTRPTIGYRLFAVARGVGQSTYGPTETNKRSLEIAVDQLTDAQTKLELAKAKMSALAQDLLNAGAPWIEGEALPER